MSSRIENPLWDAVRPLAEGRGGSCADDPFFNLLDAKWRKVASHTPVRWRMIHDVVTVYERIAR
jgi:hypothetical protein